MEMVEIEVKMETKMSNSNTNSSQTINNHIDRSDNTHVQSVDSGYTNKKHYEPAIEGTEDLKKYTRFNDLKLLNEQMINLANNMQTEESPLEVLSQEQRGEIKVLLMKRVGKLSFLPAITALLLTLTIILTDYILITLIVLIFYFFVLGRVFFYPAKLYYENIQYKTSKHAEIFYEEMDFWYKLGVVNTFISIFVISVITFILIFFEDYVINILIDLSNNATSGTKDFLSNYVTSISFSYSLFFAFVLYIGTIIIYMKFINKEKSRNEVIRQERLKSIRNETMSRVEQSQTDKNEVE
jgi:hypothetical protein